MNGSTTTHDTLMDDAVRAAELWEVRNDGGWVNLAHRLRANHVVDLRDRTDGTRSIPWRPAGATMAAPGDSPGEGHGLMWRWVVIT